MANGGKHFAHLAFSPLMDNYLNYGELAGFTEHLELGGRGPATFQLYSLGQALSGFNGGAADNFGHIGFRDFKTRMQDALGKFPVIGEQQGAFRIEIKPADREYPLDDSLQKRGDNGTALGITQGGDVASWLIEQNIDFFFRGMDGLAVQTDLMSCGINLDPHVGDDLAVNGDSPCADVLFGRAPGTGACPGKNFLQTLFHLLEREGEEKRRLLIVPPPVLGRLNIGNRGDPLKQSGKRVFGREPFLQIKNRTGLFLQSFDKRLKVFCRQAKII